MGHWRTGGAAKMPPRFAAISRDVIDDGFMTY